MKRSIFYLALGAFLVASSPASAQVFASPTTPRAIPDKAPGFSDSITVSGGPASIVSILVTLDVTHTWDNDLYLYLVPPGVTWAPPYYTGNIPAAAIALATRNGGSGQNYTNTRFTGSADPVHLAIGTVNVSVAPFTDVFLALDGFEFNMLYDSPADGDWRLVVFDDGFGDTGTLNSWSLTFPIVGTDAAIDLQRPANSSIANGSVDTLPGLYATGSPSTVSWTVQNKGVVDLLNLTGASLVEIPAASLVNCSASVAVPPSTPIAPGATSTFEVDVTPTAFGEFRFDMVIVSDDMALPTYTVTVEGFAVTPLAGTYLVSNDPSEAPDYASLGEAFDALEANGLGGPVVLDVSEGIGPYASNSSYQLGDTPIYDLSQTNNLTIRAQDYERPIIDGAGVATGVYGTMGTLAIRSTPFVTIMGLELRGGIDFGVAVIDSAAVTSDIALVGNRIHGVTAGNGIWVVGSGSPISNVTIANNMIWDIAVGDSSNPGVGGAGAIGFYNVGTNTIIRHNTVVATSGSAGGTLLQDAGAGAPFLEVSYNIFVAAIPGCTIYSLSSTMDTADYNIAFLTGGAGPFAGGVASLANWQAATGRDANSSASDPQLASIIHPSEDLHLTVLSTAAIDQAIGSTESLDNDGYPRPLAVERDIGADEYAVAPVITVTSSFGTVLDGSVLTLTEGDDLASLALTLTATESYPGQSLRLVSTVTASGDITGFVQSEWNATGTSGSVVAAPSSGVFGSPSTLQVELRADHSLGGTALFRFTIEVQARPALLATSNTVALSSGSVIETTEGSTVASLGLIFEVNDANYSDTLTLRATVSDSAAIDGFSQVEWDATGTGGSIGRTPASGTFITAGDITVELDADDGTASVATLTFTIRVTPSPTLVVATGATNVSDGETLVANVGSTVADLELTFAATDPDLEDTLTLTAVVVDSADITGFVAGEWEGSGSGGGVSASPASGRFDVEGTITVSLAVADGTGGTDTLSFAIEVVAPINAIPQLAAPSVAGDALVAGSDPRFTATVPLGGELAMAFTATDADGDDTLSLTLDVIGGTLGGAEAGFDQAFPFSPSEGPSPLTASLGGTAATAGTIEFTVTVTDGKGGTDSYTLALTITADDDQSGCGCQGGSTGSGSASGLLLFLSILLVCLPRRRRRWQLASGASL